MYCPKCGSKIPDNAAFCPSCGQPIGNTNHPNENLGQEDDYMETQSRRGGNQPQGNAGLSADTVMKIAKSPLTLAFIIAFTAQILADLFVDLFAYLGLVTEFLLLIPDILIGAGCWLIYAGNPQNHSISTGFSILRVGMVIYLVIQLLSIIESFIISYQSYSAPTVAVVLVFLIFFVISAWCLYGLCRTTNDGWKVLNGEAVRWRTSLPCFIFFILLGVYELVYLIISIIYSAHFAIILQYLLSVVALVLGIIILFEIRKENNLAA